VPNGTVSHCIPVLGCTDTGLSLLGRAYGRRAGRIEAQFSDGNFCAGNWQDGTVDFICADGDTATLPIRYTDPLTGSAEIIGRTAMGRTRDETRFFDRGTDPTWLRTG